MTREEAIKRLKETRSTIQPFGYVDEALDVAIKVLQQTRWVPVSERLPEKDGEYLVTVKSFCGEIVFKCSFAMDLHKVDEFDFQEHKCGFYGSDSEWGYYEINDVIAWMPLPEPYKAESEVHCNCTKEEIAKSFIEDVEAVKDLLPRAESEDK